ncbi:hypothetical protein GNP59_17535 [Aliivibrio fischeri]|nr:hypothetical protein [Aliivibrio fischeri]MUL15490.1 hypothetical protein [Aliivibrio fischeri]
MTKLELSIVDLKSDLDRLLSILIARGFDRMEGSDFGDLLGRLIISDAETLQDVSTLFEEICEGIHHGIGLSHGEINSRSSIENYIANWDSKN